MASRAKTLISGIRTARRRGAVATALAVLTTVGMVGAPAVAHAASGISVTALAFSPLRVDASAGTATSTLTFTVADANPGATGIGGDVFIRQQGDDPGTYIGRAYDVQFAYLNDLTFSNGAAYVSGTVQASTYTYTFPVPQFASKHEVKWVVTEVDAADSTGARLAAKGPALTPFAAADAVTAAETADSTAPTYQDLSLTTNFGATRPYVYVNGTSGFQVYQFTVQDQQSGFWKGSIKLTGPGGAQITTDFAYTQETGQQIFDCGLVSGGTDRDLSCDVPVTFPAGTAAGTWTVSELRLTDNADNTATFRDLNALPVLVTSDASLSASGFSVSPNPLNTWVRPQATRLTFAVSGVQQGISAVYIDASNPLCPQSTTTPTADPDGTFSIPMTLFTFVPGCTITGIAILDGAGDLALYGTEYNAPDPGITISRIPDTTPPTVTSAALSQTTIPASQLTGFTQIQLIAQAVAPVAPINQFSTTVYDSSGNVAMGNGESATEFGGVSMNPDGTVQLGVFLPGGLAPGTYTVGFTITDAGNLTTAYGTPHGNPVPGGPQVLTVTAS